MDFKTFLLIILSFFFLTLFKSKKESKPLQKPVIKDVENPLDTIINDVENGIDDLLKQTTNEVKKTKEQIQREFDKNIKDE